MALTARNWTLNAYTLASWTDLVPAVTDPTIVKSMTVAVGSSTAHVKIRIANSGGSRAMVIPNSTLAITTGYSIDLGALTLGVGDILQVQSDVAGVEFCAFGAS